MADELYHISTDFQAFIAMYLRHDSTNNRHLSKSLSRRLGQRPPAGRGTRTGRPPDEAEQPPNEVSAEPSVGRGEEEREQRENLPGGTLVVYFEAGCHLSEKEALQFFCDPR